MREIFADRTAVVTGGASGIGKAMGAVMFRHGAHVVLADLDRETVERAAEELAKSEPAARGSVSGVTADVRDPDAMRALVDEVADRHGQLDFMFNNAGISVGGETHTMPPAYWDRIIDVNVRGVINGVNAAYPRMIAQGRGHIVNTASAAGLAPGALITAYVMSKHAIVGLTTALRPEAATHGVRVSALCPGAVDTPILDEGPPADLPAPTEGRTPLTGRRYMQVVGLTPIPAEKFADAALRQVASNKAIIVVPSSARALWYLARCSPGVIERINRMNVRRVLRASDGE
jgi:NAD(P)-dependent dehydrogenase (short-subunit alcohol dehydrogenase family)